MPKNPTNSLLDSGQINRRAFHEEHDALRVISVADSQHSLSIKAEDGDSIEAVSRAQVVKQEDGTTDCSRMRKVCIHASTRDPNTASTIYTSADGQNWNSCSPAVGQVMDLCAMFIKVENCIAVIRS
jgi:hypothetical protein